MTISSIMIRRYLLCMVLGLSTTAHTACLPPDIVENAIKGIDMTRIDEPAIESIVARGVHSGTTALRLSRQPYEITLVSASPLTQQPQFLLGMILADTSILTGGDSHITKSSFIASTTDNTVQIHCQDDSILSEALLNQEIMQTLQRAMSSRAEIEP